MIYCIWYPSGGFGHFINGVLTLHGKGFKRPTNNIKFSKTGDSHSLNLVAPKYTAGYNFEFDPNYNYCVLVDPGITNTSQDFMSEFSNAQFIKVCYTDWSWPVVAITMINKAMKSSIEKELAVDVGAWTLKDSIEAWAQREKYFLFLRDHKLRTAWCSEPNIDCIFVDDLLDYSRLKYSIEKLGIKLDEFKGLWNEWYAHNEKYLAPVIIAKNILDNIRRQEPFDLTHITDIWTQAIIYYFIWIEFGHEVPHQDFEKFFTNVSEITQWLNL